MEQNKRCSIVHGFIGHKFMVRALSQLK